jgi:very-short-patch-repair endonuclease
VPRSLTVITASGRAEGDPGGVSARLLRLLMPLRCASSPTHRSADHSACRVEEFKLTGVELVLADERAILDAPQSLADTETRQQLLFRPRQASLVDEDDTDEEDLATDYESVLDLMKSSGHFNTMTLRWHYRSRHEHLIAYSNASFYNGRLITFPSAIDMSDDMGVKYFHVGGTYRRSAGRDNPTEAIAVAERVIHHFDTRPNQSLGVVAFSAAQRDTIENALTLARASRPELERFFDDDRLDGFFIKSLEYVQGDGRDVMIFSIGYGPDEHGTVYKNFGALNRQGGERRLNVAITRARELVEVVTSMSAAQLGDVSNEGARHLRRYLDFAERGPVALTLELGDEGLGTDSPFEDSVIDAIRSWGFEVQPQVGVAGYRIDIGVKHPNTPGAFMLGVECDGAMYHSSRAARDRDRLRHELLESLGWRIHHIWGTAWYRNRDREMDRLKTLLEELAIQPMTGRTASPGSRRKADPVELEFEIVPVSEVPEWAVPYVVASPSELPRWLDLADLTSAHRLSEFVREVVEVESPVHIETLSTRLRDAAGIGRIGNRIAATLERAIAMSGIEFDGTFLRSGDEHSLRARMPTEAAQRSMDQVPDEELTVAVRYSVKEAGGAFRTEVMTRVCSVFGWRRKSAAMSTRTDLLIDKLLRAGVLEESGAGLREVK